VSGLKLDGDKKSSTFNCNPCTIAYRPYKKCLSNVVVISSLLIEILVLYGIVSVLLHFLILCAGVNHNMMRKHVQSEHMLIIIYT